MKLSLAHKGLIYVCLPLIVQGLFFAELYNLIGQTEKSMARQILHINMSREMNFVIIMFCRTLSACGKGAPNGLMPIAQYHKMMDMHLAKLESNIKNTNEDYQQVFISSKKLVAAQYKLLELLQHRHAESDPGSLSQLLATEHVVASAEAAAPIIYAAWTKEERLLDEEREREQDSRESIKKLIAWASIFDFFLAIVLITVFVKNITHRLNLLVKNAKVLPSSKKLPFTVRGTDEIAFLDQAMQTASTELINAAGYRRSLLEMMAHDLRNPLMAIGVAFEVMLKGSKSGQVTVTEERLHSLLNSTKQITTLMEDMLALDRIEATDLELDLSLVQAADLVRDTIEFVKTQADGKSIDLKVKVDAFTVIVDRNRLLQVLSNLVGNAIRYSPVGSTVHITAEKVDHAAKFSVTDQGPGIPSDLHEKLFEKFFQAKPSKDVSNGLGYGLGLAICKQIMHKHGGDIGLDSEVGKGSTFWLTLPLEKESDD